MKKDKKKSFDVKECLENVSSGERFAYKLLRVLGWICVVIGVLFAFAAFDFIGWLGITALTGGMGLACLLIANACLKKMSSPEYRKQRESEIQTSQAARAAVGAVTKVIVQPSVSVPEEDEAEAEEDEEDEVDTLENNVIEKERTPNIAITKVDGGTTMIKKSVASIKSHVGSISEAAASALPDIVSSMSDDEVILHAFTSMMLERNPGRPGRDSITNAVNILTNKRYYFAGTDGQSTIIIPQKKSGSVALKDVHATNSGTITLQGAYVGFETRNDDYKIWLGAGVKSGPIKAWLDEAIRKAQDVEIRGTTIQAALSPADELKKFKELLDMGVISQEEFDAKKKQLLGM